MTRPVLSSAQEAILRRAIKTGRDREGCVRDLRTLKGLPLGLEQSALAAVRNWSFEPATLAGSPVKVYYILTINFQGDEKKN